MTPHVVSAQPPAASTLSTVSRSRRRRRPSGEPPPLPRQIDATGKYWLTASLAVLGFSAFLLTTSTTLSTNITVADIRVVSWLADHRNSGLTHVMRAVGWLASALAIQLAWWANLGVLLVTRRWRHLFVWIAAMFTVTILADLAGAVAQRPRPLGIEIVGDWRGFAMPSLNVSVLTALLVNTLYALVPQGRLRQIGKAVATGIVAAVILSRLYLGQDAPTDALVGVLIGVTIPLLAFRLLVPHDIFPVRYRRARKAHLSVEGARGVAIRRALTDQLGLTALEIKPFGLAGSGGSTPLRIRVDGDPPTYVFGKLYAATHLRSDRWYKLGRSLLYGGLEDEKAYNSVRRLVQYEDYALRLLQAAGLPVPAPVGIVEITPEREYLLVMEFFDGAQEVGEVDVDETVMDQGLHMMRQLWEAGLAHRDIKPANLLVRENKLLLIDSAFTQVRPSPWRQAVDLANMMLVLALRSDARRVYDRAQRFFTVDEIAEAFAATRGLTMPSQLRRLMRAQGRNLHAEFKQLLPYSVRPIAIQRWSVRRAVMLLAAVVILVIGLQIGAELLRSPL